MGKKIKEEKSKEYKDAPVLNETELKPCPFCEGEPCLASYCGYTPYYESLPNIDEIRERLNKKRKSAKIKK